MYLILIHLQGTLRKIDDADILEEQVCQQIYQRYLQARGAGHSDKGQH